VPTGHSWTNLMLALVVLVLTVAAAAMGRHRGGLYAEQNLAPAGVKPVAPSVAHAMQHGFRPEVFR
jgi:hypothetical protein